MEVVATVALCARDAAEDAAIDVRSSQLKLQVRVWLAPVAESFVLFGSAHLRLPVVAVDTHGCASALPMGVAVVYVCRA